MRLKAQPTSTPNLQILIKKSVVNFSTLLELIMNSTGFVEKTAHLYLAVLTLWFSDRGNYDKH